MCNPLIHREDVAPAPVRSPGSLAAWARAEKRRQRDLMRRLRGEEPRTPAGWVPATLEDLLRPDPGEKGGRPPSSRYRWVTRYKGRWRGYLPRRGARPERSLGWYASEEEAAQAVLGALQREAGAPPAVTLSVESRPQRGAYHKRHSRLQGGDRP